MYGCLQENDEILPEPMAGNKVKGEPEAEPRKVSYKNSDEACVKSSTL